jgi:hypothetical protein
MLGRMLLGLLLSQESTKKIDIGLGGNATAGLYVLCIAICTIP